MYEDPRVFWDLLALDAYRESLSKGQVHVSVFFMQSGAYACWAGGQAATCTRFIVLILTKHPVYPS